MTHAGAAAAQRDRSVEILELSAALWRRWREIRETGGSGDDLRVEAAALVQDAAGAGEGILSVANREVVQSEIDRWRRWFADELGEYLPPVTLAESRLARDELLQRLDYDNLMILLARGEVICGKLVQGIEFAKHLDEVREGFSESKLIDCRFDRCRFDGAQFGSGTKLVYVTFLECTMDHLIWPLVRASSLIFEDLSIRGARFESGVFSDVLFRNFRTDRADFTDANFTYCRLDGVHSVGTDYAGAVFSKCIFDGSDFVGCDFSDTVFSECTFYNATIAGGSLRRALFTSCDLIDLQLTQGPPRGGEASRRLLVDTDLASIQVKDCYNLPALIDHHLLVEDLGSVADAVLPKQGER